MAKDSERLISVAGREPAVSVCIPTYNRSKLLREAIEGVLDQSFTDFELIISDNRSEDDTESVVSSFRDSRIRYAKQKTNIGVVGNFNQCLALAKGRYVTIFHDDDIMLPNNLLLKVRALDENPSVGFVHSKFHVIDEQGDISEYDTNLGQQQTSDLLERGHDFLTKSLLGGNPVIQPTVMMRKECYSKLGGFTDKVIWTTDFEYWMRISFYYDVMFLATPLIKCRMHGGWATGKYMTVMGGDLVPNFQGLAEIFGAKRLILKRTKYGLMNWEEIQGKVRERLTEEIVVRLDSWLEEQDNKHFPRGDITRLCKLFPEILGEKPAIKLLLRAHLGKRIFDHLRTFAGYLNQR
jgi:glycosyltransferase involved in cell wall biosynthesis